MSHGAGGKATQTLIEAVFLDAFRNPQLEPLEDAAELTINGTRLALTTDSYVVKPLFFPGGDIGDLAVNGTVNDLSVAGATPLYLSAGFILEEGFPVADLSRGGPGPAGRRHHRVRAHRRPWHHHHAGPRRARPRGGHLLRHGPAERAGSRSEEHTSE